MFWCAFRGVFNTTIIFFEKGARKVANGHFGHIIEVKGKDELAHTAHSFNTMSTALAEFAKEAKAAREYAEERQLYAENTLYDAMSSMSQAIVIVDAEGQIEYINSAFYALFGESVTPLKAGFHYKDVIHALAEHEILSTYDGHYETIREQWLVQGQHPLSWQSSLKDGTQLLNLYKEMRHGGMLFVHTDVSELYKVMEKNRRLEMELMQTGKMESLGTLASGIAHEINTPVQYIGDNLRFMQESWTDLFKMVSQLTHDHEKLVQNSFDQDDWSYMCEEVPLALKEALSGVASIHALVRSVKEFSHPEQKEKSSYDVAKLINNAVNVSRSQWRHSCDVTTHIEDDVGFLDCYPGDLGQVLINLIVNAKDAIIEKEDGFGLIHIHAYRKDEDVFISVEDNGLGMGEALQNKIFDLFYTTKDSGKGTGQGLAICHSIIETKHKGKLSVASQEGKGSIFTLQLPCDHKLEKVS